MSDVTGDLFSHLVYRPCEATQFIVRTHTDGCGIVPGCNARYALVQTLYRSLNEAINEQQDGYSNKEQSAGRQLQNGVGSLLLLLSESGKRDLNSHVSGRSR